VLGAEREVVGQKLHSRKGVAIAEERTVVGAGAFGEARLMPVTVAASSEAKQWQGWGTALKPAHEPIVVARKPLIGTVAETVLKYGTGGINIDASRVGTEQLGGGTMPDLRDVGAMSKEATGIDKLSFGQNPRPAERKEQPKYTGRFPANTLLTHNHDCQATGTTNEDVAQNISFENTKQSEGWGTNRANTEATPITTTTYTCTPNCPVATLNQQSGLIKGGVWNQTQGARPFNNDGKETNYKTSRSDSSIGGASRFFHNSQWQPADDITPFIYQAKAGKKERNAGLDGLDTRKSGKMMRTANNTSDQQSEGFERFGTEPSQNFHPTVKPIELMRYLIKLITPPKGTVLDPFLGSGTTAVAAVLEGFEWKGCEMTDDYLPIIKARVSWAKKQVKKSAKQQELEL
jgi:site-specific DNA-methyltransferase (adenine-specific)